MGVHDSELSIVMEDYRTLDSKMDGQAYKAGHHAATLRRLLWREHLGLLPAQKLDASDDPNAQPPDVCANDVMEGAEYDFVADPLDDQVWAMWTENATKNTELFRHLFRADPDDNSKKSNRRFIIIFFSLPPLPVCFLLNERDSITFANFLGLHTTVKTFDDYEAFLPRHKRFKQGHLHDPFMPAEEVRQKLDQIKGHLVWMPLDFLRDAEMAEKGLALNAYTESIYT